MRLPNAIWGLIIVPLLSIIVAVMVPAISQVRGIAKRAVCSSNLIEISAAMTAYLKDHEGLYPPADKWCDALIQESNVSRNKFCCPVDRKNSFSYAMNKTLCTSKVVSSQRVVLFEANLGINGSGGIEHVVLRHNDRGQSGCNILLANGNVIFVPENKISTLDWGL